MMTRSDVLASYLLFPLNWPVSVSRSSPYIWTFPGRKKTLPYISSHSDRLFIRVTCDSNSFWWFESKIV